MLSFLKKLLFILLISLLFSNSNAKSSEIIRDSEIEFELENVANDLAKAAKYNSYIKVRIVLDPNFNAFVVGDDTIYLNSGLLIGAKSIEEIIGVMAHELGHIVSGHIFLRSEDFKNANYASVLSAAAAVALAAGGATDAALGIMIGGSDQGKRKFFKSSRDKEAVADEWALKLLKKINVSNQGLVELMRKLASQKQLQSNSRLSYYTTHPDIISRISIFEDDISNPKQNNSYLNTTKKRSFESLIVKLISFTSDPKKLINEDVKTNLQNTKPSKNLVKYSKSIAFYRIGNLKKAHQLMKELINIEPQNPFFHEFLGDIYFSLGNLDNSINSYQKSLSLRPKNTLVMLSLGKSLMSKKEKQSLNEAVKILEKVMFKEPNWSVVKRQLAIAYGVNGDLANADILLAEEAIILGKKKQAVNFAKKVLKYKNLPIDIKIKAEDIIFFYGNN